MRKSTCRSALMLSQSSKSHYPFCVKYVYEPQGYVNYQCEESAYNEQVTLSGTWTGASFEPTKDTVCSISTSYSEGYGVGRFTTIGVTEESTSSTTTSQTRLLSIISSSFPSTSTHHSPASTLTLSGSTSPTLSASDAQDIEPSSTTIQMALLAALVAYWQC